MKNKTVLSGIVLLLAILMALPGTSQVPRDDDNQESSSSGSDTTGVTGGLMTGAVTINGKNYQRLGIRTDVPLGKLGFGVDIELLMDSEGQIRKADWDEWTDYLDKIYYVRYGYRNSPFYMKFGGMDYSYIGYRNIIDGYSNMIEYPDVKRYGLEMSIDTKNFGVELFANDFKELFQNKSLVLGSRLSYKVIGKLEIGASFATDLNEYNGLKDLDQDDYPDAIDRFPENEDLVTEYDQYVDKAKNNGDLTDQEAEDFADQAVQYDIIDGTRKADLFNLSDNKSQSLVYSVDIGYPVIKRPNFSLDLFSHYTKIQDHGWGITAPGMLFGIGKFLTFRAEYRIQSKEFEYGYFNQTYELERAQFVQEGDTSYFRTKQETLMDIKNDLKGYFAGLTIDFFGFAGLTANYQNMTKGDKHVRSIHGSLELKDKLVPVIHEAKAYYVQNNVENFKEWKTPSTVMGYIMSYDFNGTVVGLDYRYTFRDVNGDNKISGKEETIKTFGISTKMTF